MPYHAVPVRTATTYGRCTVPTVYGRYRSVRASGKPSPRGTVR